MAKSLPKRLGSYEVERTEFGDFVLKNRTTGETYVAFRMVDGLDDKMAHHVATVIRQGSESCGLFHENHFEFQPPDVMH